jgi:HPr kinase/phosphorylase
MNKGGVSVSKIVELMDLKVFTDNIDLKKRKIQSADINRPALQLAGFFDHFESTRVQVVGNVEYFYTGGVRSHEGRLFVYR